MHIGKKNAEFIHKHILWLKLLRRWYQWDTYIDGDKRKMDDRDDYVLK